MPSISADNKLKLPAISMSLDQFRALIGDLKNHFPGDVVSSTITVRHGVETLTYSELADLTAEDPALPDTLNEVHVEIFDAQRSYDATHTAKLGFRHGDTMNPNEARVEGPTKGWVFGLSRTIADGCRRRAPWYSLMYLHHVLVALAFGMLAGFFVLPTVFPDPKMHPGLRWGFPAYLISLILLAIFVGFDTIYYAVFPSTVITARMGPRRWPYESLMLILAVVGLIFAILAFARS